MKENGLNMANPISLESAHLCGGKAEKARQGDLRTCPSQPKKCLRLNSSKKRGNIIALN